MPGDYSRKTFNSKKHYSGVLMQQGRVQLDADWNEEVEIEQYRTFTESIDVIGESGAPQKNPGFGITLAANGADLLISPGRMYVNGLLCELEPDQTVTYRTQSYYPDPDLTEFAAPASPATSPPGAASLKDGSYVVYLKAWQKEVNYIDDPSIQEIALGEADTTTRLQTVWQVRLLKVQDNGSASCNSSFPEWNALTASPNGKLSAKTKPAQDDKDPCVLPAQAGFLRLENQLYRVQVQKVNAAGKVQSIVWSRNNASIETRISNVAQNVLTVDSLGRDEISGFAGNQWAEIVDRPSSFGAAPNPLVQIDKIFKDSLGIKLKTIPQYRGNAGLKLRLWDMTDIATTSNGLPVITSSWTDIEDGIQVFFDNGTFEVGDYWLIPARTINGNIEWPELSSGVPAPQARKGTNYSYCRLAFIKIVNGQVVVQEDCRELFPSLTDICAKDICFDNTTCKFPPTVKNVQQALDLLCQKTSGGGACTYVVKPVKGWEAVFANIPDGADAQICFQAGVYPLDQLVIIKGKGNLKLTGCGPATRIICANTEIALIFDRCKVITIRDMHAEARLIRNELKLPFGLNGVISFMNCASVNIDQLSIKSGASATRSCTCITVNNDMATPCPVRIEDCDLEVATLQQGILLVNVSEAWVESNNIKGYDIANRKVTEQKLELGIRNRLASNIRVGKIGKTSPDNNVMINSGDFTVNFHSDSSLKNEWREALEAEYPTPARSAEELRKRVSKLAARFVTDKKLMNRFRLFEAYINGVAAQNKSFAAQGITIGGRLAKDIHVLNNVISNVLQGIHAGVSHRTKNREPDTMSNLLIAGNSIHILLPDFAGKIDRYGIFVGNAQNTIIENNTIKLERTGSADILINGISVWGFLGRRLMIAQNLVESMNGDQKKSFDHGIVVMPLKEKTINDQWAVMWNVVPSKRSPAIIVRNGALKVENTNVPN
jgi:hypothetical protein